MILPDSEAGSEAYDKTNHYDFVYYNHVIKPALVGLCGPWISGGIEFNWPQHHRPTTFSPVDYLLIENPDGSKKTCRVSDVDQMYRNKKRRQALPSIQEKAYMSRSKASSITDFHTTDLPLVGKPGGSRQRSHTVDLPAGCTCSDGSWKT